MSELTPCNYCTLKGIKSCAKRDNKIVKTLSGGMGTQVFVYPPDIDLTSLPEGNWDDKTGKMKYCVAELMEITNHCVC